ncbi:hypothetical protein BTHE_1425 [Bifidobacterium thermophilum]|nr:hypothetical protein BTHE_1425 [Bifidobacterium thermophilum]
MVTQPSRKRTVKTHTTHYPFDTRTRYIHHCAHQRYAGHLPTHSQPSTTHKKGQAMTEQLPRMDSTLAALDRLMSESRDDDDDHKEA